MRKVFLAVLFLTGLASAAELAAERQKGFIPGKPMENEDVLEALHDDGLF